jgi:hypothetical protein
MASPSVYVRSRHYRFRFWLREVLRDRGTYTNKPNAKTCSGKVNYQVTEPGVSCWQRHLKQLNAATKDKRQQQKTDKGKSVTDGKDPGDERKGHKVFTELPCPGYRAIDGRNNGQNDDRRDTKPSQRSRSRPGLTNPPAHDFDSLVLWCKPPNDVFCRIPQGRCYCVASALGQDTEMYPRSIWQMARLICRNLGQTANLEHRASEFVCQNEVVLRLLSQCCESDFPLQKSHTEADTTHPTFTHAATPQPMVRRRLASGGYEF